MEKSESEFHSCLSKKVSLIFLPPEHYAQDMFFDLQESKIFQQKLKLENIKYKFVDLRNNSFKNRENTKLKNSNLDDYAHPDYLDWEEIKDHIQYHFSNFEEDLILFGTSCSENASEIIDNAKSVLFFYSTDEVAIGALGNLREEHQIIFLKHYKDLAKLLVAHSGKNKKILFYDDNQNREELEKKCEEFYEVISSFLNGDYNSIKTISNFKVPSKNKRFEYNSVKKGQEKIAENLLISLGNKLNETKTEKEKALVISHFINCQKFGSWLAITHIRKALVGYNKQFDGFGVKFLNILEKTFIPLLKEKLKEEVWEDFVVLQENLIDILNSVYSVCNHMHYVYHYIVKTDILKSIVQLMNLPNAYIQANSQRIFEFFLGKDNVPEMLIDEKYEVDGKSVAEIALNAFFQKMSKVLAFKENEKNEKLFFMSPELKKKMNEYCSKLKEPPTVHVLNDNECIFITSNMYWLFEHPHHAATVTDKNVEVILFLIISLFEDDHWRTTTSLLRILDNLCLFGNIKAKKCIKEHHLLLINLSTLLIVNGCSLKERHIIFLQNFINHILDLVKSQSKDNEEEEEEGEDEISELEEKRENKNLNTELLLTRKKVYDSFSCEEEREWSKFWVSERNKIEIEELKNKNLNLEKSIEEKDKIIKELDEEISESKEKIESLENENKQNKKVIENLRKITKKEPQITKIQEPIQIINLEQNKEIDSSEEEMEKIRNYSSAKIEENEAKKMVKTINEYWKTFKKGRKSLSGTLKNLGPDQYSRSESHFLQEMIQNVHDNTFSENEEPKILIEIDTQEEKPFVLIASNENGFTPKDVHSVCNIARSSKKIGEHIGQKGLGFKSVFACTENPIIYSNSWKFQFKADKKESDEIERFLTPFWVEELPKRLLSNLEEYNTKFFLPLKQSIIFDERFVKEFEQAADPMILLSIEKIKELHFVKKLKGKESFECVYKIIEEKQEKTKQIEFKTERFKEILGNITKREVKLFENDKEIGNFIIFKYQVIIPEDLKRDSTNKTNIKMAFKVLDGKQETDLKKEETIEDDILEDFSIYAGLPIYNMGFKFLINADFALITNREGILENNQWNLFLRDELVSMFVALCVSNDYLNDRFELFIPNKIKIGGDNKAFWNRFIDELFNSLKESKDLILSSGSKNIEKRSPNKQIESFISHVHLKDSNLEGSHQWLKNFSKVFVMPRQVHKAFDLKCLSCLDLLNGLKNDTSITKKNEDWFNKLFSLLKNELLKLNEKGKKKEKEKLIELLIQLPIFSLNHSDCNERTKLPKSKQFFLINKKICEYWREKNDLICFLSYSSLEEQQVLLYTNICVSEKSIEEICKFIENIHVENRNQRNLIGNKEQLWKDLKFIKSNFNHTNFRNKEFEELHLFVPVKSNTQNFEMIKKTFLPSIIGIQLEIASQKSQTKKKFEMNAKTFIEFEENLTLSETLEWELFFLKCKCSIHKANSVMSFKNELFDFEKYKNPIDAKNATEILYYNNKNILDLLGKLECKSTKGNIKLSNICSSELIEEVKGIPSIKLPKGTQELAEKLGVKIESDLELSLKALRNLCEYEDKEQQKYYKWLVQLNCFLSEIKEVNKSQPIIYLKSQEAEYSFVGVEKILIVNDVLISKNHKDVINLICQKNKLFLVDIFSNVIFSPFFDLFQKLGCKTLNLNFCLEQLQSICLEKENKNEICKTLLTISEKQEMYSILLLLHDLIKKEIAETCLNNEELKIIDSDLENEKKRNLVDYELRTKTIPELFKDEKLEKLIKKVNDNIILYSSNSILQDFRTLAKNNKNVYANLNTFFTSNHDNFIAFEIIRDCPYLIGALGITYFETKHPLNWRRVCTNAANEIPFLSKKFQEWLKDETIEVVQQKYVSVSFEGTKSFTIEDESRKFLIFKNEKKTIVVVNSFSGYFPGKLQLVCSALARLLQEYQINLTPQKAIEKAITFIDSCASEIQFPTNSQQRYNYPKQHIYENCFETVLFPQTNLFQQKKISLTGKWANLQKKDENYSNNNNKDNKLELSDSNDIKDNNENNENNEMNISDNNDFNVSNIYRKKMEILAKIAEKQVKEENFHNYNIKKSEEIPNKLQFTEINQFNQINQFNEISQFEEKEKIGLEAEMYFFNVLKSKYKENINPGINWVSSNASKVFKNVKNMVDDGKGYDFEFKDIFNFFTKKKNQQCFVEVKGSAFKWNGTFFMSKNEKKFADEKLTQKDFVNYFIVIVENVFDVENIRIVEFFSWDECYFRNDDVKTSSNQSEKGKTCQIHFDPQEYCVTWFPKIKLIPFLEEKKFIQFEKEKKFNHSLKEKKIFQFPKEKNNQKIHKPVCFYHFFAVNGCTKDYCSNSHIITTENAFPGSFLDKDINKDGPINKGGLCKKCLFEKNNNHSHYYYLTLEDFSDKDREHLSKFKKNKNNSTKDGDHLS